MHMRTHFLAHGEELNRAATRFSPSLVSAAHFSVRLQPGELDSSEVHPPTALWKLSMSLNWGLAHAGIVFSTLLSWKIVWTSRSRLCSLARFWCSIHLSKWSQSSLFQSGYFCLRGLSRWKWGSYRCNSTCTPFFFLDQSTARLPPWGGWNGQARSETGLWESQTQKGIPSAFAPGFLQALQKHLLFLMKRRDATLYLLDGSSWVNVSAAEQNIELGLGACSGNARRGVILCEIHMIHKSKHHRVGVWKSAWNIRWTLLKQRQFSCATRRCVLVGLRWPSLVLVLRGTGHSHSVTNQFLFSSRSFHSQISWIYDHLISLGLNLDIFGHLTSRYTQYWGEESYCNLVLRKWQEAGGARLAFFWEQLFECKTGQKIRPFHSPLFNIIQYHSPVRRCDFPLEEATSMGSAPGGLAQRLSHGALSLFSISPLLRPGMFQENLKFEPS